ncbi:MULTISPECIES: arylesterase [unclassified Meridianimarinicoccus]|uniref:arylesterase n=1 Tax=unclassified Meridianimarinicoccus TaxID=2923344 RepID=UPI0018683F24
MGRLRGKGRLLAYGARSRGRKFLGALVLSLIPLAAAAEPVVVAALGDSLTQGYGLPVEDGLVPQLQDWLAENEVSAKVLNAGVSGDTTAGGLARIGWTLTSEVDALIVALGGNDLLRGIDPLASRANLEGILSEARGRGLPVLMIGMEAPGNYGPGYKAAFDSMYPDLAMRYDALLVPDMLAPLKALQAKDPQAMARYMQADRLHPNAEGVRVIVETIGPEVARLVARAQP